MTKIEDKYKIVHGKIEHSYSERLNCLTCLDVEIEYLQELKNAGGQAELLRGFIKEEIGILLKVNNDKDS